MLCFVSLPILRILRKRQNGIGTGGEDFGFWGFDEKRALI